ncbi:MAG: hypothetical protein GYB35_13880 [Algicola sp.]|nr:hypothetical protein [Algicola sp.]
MFHKNTPKIFCIGSGKTGTTSIEKALSDLDYKMGDQASGELLLNAYANRDFKSIVKFCKSADAFQDAPFCFQHTFMFLDQHFKDAKFILTERDSDHQWYQSLVNFHTKLFGNGSRTPNWQDLKATQYRYPGYVAEVRKRVFGINEDENPYDEKKLKAYYNTHNASVKDYFKNKTNLLVLNVSDKDAYFRLCEFLEKKPLYETFPWENKTSEL